jgi:hypothetical protein
VGRLLLLSTLVALTFAALPPAAAACELPPVPVYPGARQVGGLMEPSNRGWVPSTGRTYYAIDGPLRDIQWFYFTTLLNLGWTEVAQLPGQYIETFGRGHQRTDTAVGILEFERNSGQEHVWIVGEAGGYSVSLQCTNARPLAEHGPLARLAVPESADLHS